MGDIDVFTRQLDLIKPSELDFPIEIIGAGGIGSWAGTLGVDYHYELGLIVMGPGKSDYIPPYES